MGETSWQVKQKYNKKVYKTWSITSLKIDDFERIEKLREELGLSRSAFLLMLLEEYEKKDK